MRTAVALIGALVAAALLAVSAFMNFRFGFSLGKEPVDQIIYAVASLCSDGFKALMPFVIAWGWSERRPLAVLAGIALFGIATAYSVTSSIGFAANNRALVAGEKAGLIANVEELGAEIARKETRLEALAGVRPASSIAADLASLKGHRSWTSSSQCANATVPVSIQLCAEIAALDVEAQESAEKEQLDVELSAFRAKLREARATAAKAGAAGNQSDPQVALFTTILPVSEVEVRTGLAILIAAFVEFGSGFGFYLTLGHVKRRERPVEADTEGVEPLAHEATKAASVAAYSWGEERLEVDQDAGIATPAAALHDDYKAWCAGRGMNEVLSATAFGRWLGAQGFKKAKRSGRIVYPDVRLKTPKEAIRLVS